MDVREFLDAVLPTVGRRCAGSLVNGNFTNFFEPDTDRLNDAVTRIDAKGADTFFALGGFGADNKRTQANVVALRSLWLDIDTQEGKPGAYYPDRKAALVALTTFAVTVGLPNPIVVSSGYGLHAYWPFTDDCTPDVWAGVAGRLKAAAKKAALDIDNSRTTDSASVLRPPGSSNRKNESTRAVKIIQSAVAVPIQVLDRALSAYVDEDELGEPPRRMASINSDLTGGMDYAPSNANIVADHCGVVGRVRSSRGRVDQPTWYHTLGVLAATADGEALAHEWSNGYAGYSYEETSEKYEQASQHGPTTCQKFSEFQPAICQACPHFGKIKSPIVLGTARGEPQSVEAPPQVQQVTTRKHIDFPTGYGYGLVGSKPYKQMWRAVEVQDEETKQTSTEYVPFCDVLFYAFGRVRKNDGRNMMLMYYRDKTGLEKTIEIELKMLGEGGKALNSELASKEVILNTAPEQKAMEQYLRAWATKLRDEYVLTQSVDQMGWRDKDFVVGETLITATGNQKAVVSGTIEKTNGALKTKGTLQGWIDGVDLAYNRPQDRQPQPWQFSVLASFAAPLFHMYDETCSIVVHSYSPGSGYGKTTAAQAGQFAWGNSDELIIRKFTDNALYNSAGSLQNLPVVVDELTHADAKFCQDLVFTTSGGTGKVRMTKELKEAPSKNWKTIVLTSANVRLSEKLTTVRVNAAAEMARVFEFGYRYMSTITTNEAIEIFGMIRNNYGHAGPLYAEYVVRNYDAVQKLLHDTRLKLNTKLNFVSSERYWSMLFAAILTALHITKQLGLIKFDEVAMLKWMEMELANSRNNLSGKVSSPSEQFADLLSDIWGSVLVTRGPGSHTNPAAVVQPSPRGGLGGRHILAYAGNAEALYISADAIQKWCLQRNASVAEIEADLISNGVLRAQRKTELGKGTDEYGGAAAAVKVWEIDVHAMRAMNPAADLTNVVAQMVQKSVAGGKP